MWPSHLDFQRRNTGPFSIASLSDHACGTWTCPPSSEAVGGGHTGVQGLAHKRRFEVESDTWKRGEKNIVSVIEAYLASRDTFLDIFDMHILCSTYLHIWIDVWGLDISMPLREGYGWNQDISASASKKWMRYIIWKLQHLECVFWDG